MAALSSHVSRRDLAFPLLGALLASGVLPPIPKGQVPPTASAVAPSQHDELIRSIERMRQPSRLEWEALSAQIQRVAESGTKILPELVQLPSAFEPPSQPRLIRFEALKDLPVAVLSPAAYALFSIDPQVDPESGAPSVSAQRDFLRHVEQAAISDLADLRASRAVYERVLPAFELCLAQLSNERSVGVRNETVSRNEYAKLRDYTERLRKWAEDMQARIPKLKEQAKAEGITAERQRLLKWLDGRPSSFPFKGFLFAGQAIRFEEPVGPNEFRNQLR